MDARELRIGNWVRHRAGEWSYRNYSAGDGFEFQWNESDWYQLGECCLQMADVEPIPLTEEWLVRFGFDKGRDKTYYLHGQFTIYDRFGNFGLIGGSLSWTEFNYVHQLQNLYRALTGKELTETT